MEGSQTLEAALRGKSDDVALLIGDGGPVYSRGKLREEVLKMREALMEVGVCRGQVRKTASGWKMNESID